MPSVRRGAWGVVLYCRDNDHVLFYLPFVDDSGRVMLDDKGQTMRRPAGLDPHFFVRQGLQDKKVEETLASSGKAGGRLAALAYQAAALSNFRRGGEWDA